MSASALTRPAARWERAADQSAAGTAALRVLDARAAAQVDAVLARDPVAHAFVTGRVETADRARPVAARRRAVGLRRRRRARVAVLRRRQPGPGRGDHGGASRAFADRARRQGRRCSSIVGPADEVLGMWELLEPSWGPAREVRDAQPLMATGVPAAGRARPARAPGPAGRARHRACPPASRCSPRRSASRRCSATAAPPTGPGSPSWSRCGRAFARIEDGRVVFKAEVGAVTRRPARCRACGSTRAGAARASAPRAWPRWSAPASTTVAPVVSLYVNDYNLPALAHVRPGRLLPGRHVRDRPVLTTCQPRPPPWRRCGLTTRSRRSRPADILGPPTERPRSWPWSCACRPCSCAPCARTRPTPRSRATACSCAPATSAASRPASSPGCRWATWCCATSSGSSARRWTRAGAQEVHFPALLPREPYEATGRWTEYGDGIFRLQGPQGRRLPARPDPRGDVHPAGQGPVLLVQGPAAVALPDPDQVPRRGAAAGRHPARPRVRHEGLVLLRRRRRRAAARPTRRHRDGLHADLRPARPRLRHRLGDVRRDGRQRERGVPRARRENGEDTYVRCTNGDYAANVEAVAHAGRPPRVAVRRRAGRARRGHPGHPDHRHARRRSSNARPDLRRPTATGRRPTRSRTSSSRVTHPDGTQRAARRRRARRPRGRHEAARGAASHPAERRAGHRGGLRGATRRWSRATSGRRRSGEKSASGIRYLVDPRVVDGTRWITGANEPGRHVFDLVAGRDFTADGTIEAAEVRDGRPVPGLRRRRSRSRAASRSATSSSSAASTPRRSDLKVLDENGKQVVVTMGSYGIGVSRAVAAIAEQTCDELGPVLAARGRARPTCTSSPPARTTRSSRPPSRSTAELEAPRRPGAARRPARASRPG